MGVSLIQIWRFYFLDPLRILAWVVPMSALSFSTPSKKNRQTQTTLVSIESFFEGSQNYAV